MKALVVTGPGRVGLVEIPEPAVADGHVLVYPVLSGLCGTDLEIIAGTIDEAYVHYPVALGHEWVGRLSEEGPLVVVEGIIPCGTCDECLRGATNRCRQYDEIGFTRHGALAECIAVPTRLVHEMRPTVSAFDAALVEPMAVVWRALTRANVTIGSRCLVIGDGTVALLCALLLQRFEPASVTMLGRRHAQADLAHQVGVSSFVTDLAGEQYDFVIEAAGVAESVATALTAANRGGVIVILGLTPHGTTVEVHPDDVVNNDLIIQGSFSYTRRAWSDVVSLLNDGLVRPGFLVTHTFPLGQWREAIGTLESVPADVARGKVVITTEGLSSTLN
jgi:threonine dehydrogenase-like Zn-dependent dehydrogenase